MSIFYSPSREGFFDEAIHGPRRIQVVDQAAEQLLQGEIERLAPVAAEEGEDSAAAARIRELEAAGAPLVEVDNPDCKVPADAIELSQALHAELLEGLGGGKAIAMINGAPTLVSRELPVDEQLEILRRRRDTALAATDWTQLPDALTAAKRKLWKEHRQALRDLPAMVEEAVKAGRPVDSVAFPAAPEA